MVEGTAAKFGVSKKYLKATPFTLENFMKNANFSNIIYNWPLTD
jgi:hypothetical protein